MSIDLATSATTQLPAAATAVAQAWGLADTLAISEPTTELSDIGLTGQVVIVEFTGRATGDLAIIVDDEITQQLMDSPASPPDLITALGPAVTAACLAIGDVTATNTQVADIKVVIRRLLAQDDAAGVLLTANGEVRAAVLTSAQPPATEDSAEATIPAQSGPAQGGPTHDGRARANVSEPSAQRLDLLRGVQMQASVELGRTEMTINDLLSLRSGAVIELDRSAGAPADLFVNGRLIAHGEVVVVDENYGLRILQVVSDETIR